MSAKFKRLPLRDWNTYLFQIQTKFDSWDVLYEGTIWLGLKLESIIFLTSDINHLSDAELEKRVRLSPVVKEDCSIMINKYDLDFTFVNFNVDIF
jgi:hypothetical protein